MSFGRNPSIEPPQPFQTHNKPAEKSPSTKQLSRTPSSKPAFLPGESIRSPKPLTLHQTLDLIEELFVAKSHYDQKCIEMEYPY